MNILFPTDFSDNSKNASDFAIELVKKSQGKLNVFHAYEPPYTDRSISNSLLDAMKKNAEENMAIYLQGISEDNLNMGTELVVGNPIRIAKDLIKKHQIDMVVMGTTGASGIEELLIGSNASAFIQSVDIPVLVIPAEAKPKDFKKIVLASDLDFKEKERPLERLRKFAALHQASIEILHIQNSNKPNLGNRDLVEKTLGNIPHSYTIIKEDNIEQSILKMGEEKEADMLCAITKKYSFLEGLFKKSLTSKLAYHATIPLLALHEPK